MGINPLNRHKPPWTRKNHPLGTASTYERSIALVNWESMQLNVDFMENSIHDNGDGTETVNIEIIDSNSSLLLLRVLVTLN